MSQKSVAPIFLTYSFFAPMLAWITQLIVCFMVVSYASQAYLWWVYPTTLITLVISLLGIFAGLKSYRHYKDVSRSAFAFLSIMSLLLAAIYSLAILVQGSVPLFLGNYL